MERYIIENLEFSLPFADVAKRMRLQAETDKETVRPLYEQALAIARPKAVYRIAYVESISRDHVNISGTEFTSHMMTENLQDIHRVFPYVVTCGTEVDDWTHLEKDYFFFLWLDIIKEMILEAANETFLEYISSTYHIEKTASMNPGSGDADIWPLEQQYPLFNLIGNVEEIGVQLTSGLLMLPTKTVSGILFPSDSEYVNCAYCSRENCPGRRAETVSELRQ